MLILAAIVFGFVGGVIMKGLIDAPEFNRISSDNQDLRAHINTLRLKLDRHETWDPNDA